MEIREGQTTDTQIRPDCPPTPRHMQIWVQIATLKRVTWSCWQPLTSFPLFPTSQPSSMKCQQRIHLFLWEDKGLPVRVPLWWQIPHHCTPFSHTCSTLIQAAVPPAPHFFLLEHLFSLTSPPSILYLPSSQLRILLGEEGQGHPQRLTSPQKASCN